MYQDLDDSETNRQLSQIWDEYHNPRKIKKRRFKERIKKIKEEKLEIAIYE